MKKLLSALLGIFGLFIVPAYAALPSGYTQLEYIESTGTQYIDTGVIVDDMTYVFKSDFATTVHDTNVIFGTMNVSEGYPGIVVNASGSFRYGTQQIASSVDFAVGTKYSIELLYQNLKVDGTNYAASGTTNNTALTYPMFLFARNNVGTAGNFASVKMYSWQMYDNGTLKRDFVPAKNASGKIGMYDTVNDVFYENKGSGEFIAGDPVVSSNTCNLFDMSQTPYNSGAYISSATVGQTGFSTDVNTNYNVYRIKVQPNTTYTFGKIKANQPYWVVTDSSNKVLQTAQNNGGTGGVDITITTEASAKYLYLSVSINGTYKCDDILQLERGSTATSYTPYNPSCGCNGEVVTYTSATGTVSQVGTPTPTNPIYPTFYTNGNMVLRKVGDYADSYDATTGKITRRVGVKVLDGTEDWVVSSSYLSGMYNLVIDGLYAVGQNDNVSSPYSSHFGHTTSWIAMGGRTKKVMSYKAGNTSVIGLGYDAASADNLEGFKAWLAAQKEAGTPVTVYYPLTTTVEEDWTESSYCYSPIKIATTKYNETAFSPLNTALANAISVVDTVVSNTITQAGRIATLQAQKQTRPNDIADDSEKCPAGKKCLLVEDASGVPHWYEIVEPLLPAGYIQLQWIESTGTQFIDTGIKANASIVVDMGVLFSRTGPVYAALGTRNGTNTSDTNIFQFGINSNNLFFHRYGMGAPDGTGVPVAQTLYDVHLENYKEIISNGQDTYTNTLEFNPNMDTEGTLYIFATHDISSGRPIFSMAGYITYLSISVNGVLVRDFVPAKNPDGKIGMYDLVGGRFYENAGTGEFIAGNPVSE